jgi:hypothetical protein
MRCYLRTWCWRPGHKTPFLLILKGLSELCGIEVVVVVDIIVAPFLVSGGRWTRRSSGSRKWRHDLQRLVVHEVDDMEYSFLLVSTQSRILGPDGRLWRIDK